MASLTAQWRSIAQTFAAASRARAARGDTPPPSHRWPPPPPGKVTTWMRPASFPSEPTFLASGEEEGQGALLVTVLNGTSGRSSFLTLDATTMQPTLEVPLPVRIPFTTHGQWYPRGG